MFVLVYQLHESNKFTKTKKKTPDKTKLGQKNIKMISQDDEQQLLSTKVNHLTKDCSTVCKNLQNITSSKREMTF